ncbi:MAG: glycosyltransferase [Bacteroidota bacterium]
MKPKHIYWFSYFNTSEASVRYRALYPLQQLREEHGITGSFVFPSYRLRDIWVFISTFFEVFFFRKQDSLIVYQKIYTRGLYASALKLLLKVHPTYTMYDIDDAEYLRRPCATIFHFMQNCERINTGSLSLQQYCTPINGNSHVLTSPVIPHQVTKLKRSPLFTVGWIGYYGAHKESLLTLVFPALLDIDFPCRFILLGVQRKEEQNEIITYFKHKTNIELHIPIDLNWHDELSIYSHILEFDLGLSPLLDTEFNRSKSAFKLKQCLSCGIPVIASKTGENKSFITPSLNGFLADSPEDFTKYILHVYQLQDTDYINLCQNARATYTQFSMEGYCDQLLDDYGNTAQTVMKKPQLVV